MRYIQLADEDDDERQEMLRLGEEHIENLLVNISSKSIKEKF